jgi:hypothetical protein
MIKRSSLGRSRRRKGCWVVCRDGNAGEMVAFSEAESGGGGKFGDMVECAFVDVRVRRCGNEGFERSCFVSRFDGVWW